MLTGKRKVSFYNHISAKEVKTQIGEDVWNSYFKFCFERNPWDRVISLYYWRCRTEPRPTISQFLKTTVPLDLKRFGFGIYTIDDQIAVDKICRFESISEELEVIRKRLGIPDALELPRAKSKLRKDKRSYRDILNEEEKLKIEEMFHEEISLLGYEF